MKTNDEMNISEALEIISGRATLDKDDINSDDIEFELALYKIMEVLGMTYNNTTEQFVTQDTGDII
jgi:hypothetical protein